MQSKRSVSILVTFIVVLFLSGCSQKFYDGHKVQSDFTPPNSNVELINKKVVGHASHTVVYPMGATLAQPGWTSEMFEQAKQKALEGTDGELLANIDVLKKMTIIPLLLVTIVTSSYEIEGQPAKIVEVGEQELK